MSQYSYVPGDQRLVDHIIGELKSKGIFDQFRKECIADVDTRPAYQNLRLRVEGSVSGFLSHQRWRPDLNKNALREKLRKHIHEANYLEQGVERIVDQVVNPKVSSVFIPQVEDLVYSYLGIERPKIINSNNAYTSGYVSTENLLPTDLEAVSPDSVKSQEIDDNDKNVEILEVDKLTDCAKMEVDTVEDKPPNNQYFESPAYEAIEKSKNESTQDTQLSGISDLTSHGSNDINLKVISVPEDKIKTDEIKSEETDVIRDTEQLVRTRSLSNLSMDIPLPDDPPKIEIVQEESVQTEFKASSDAESSSDSTMMRNVSPLTPIRSFNNENSCDAQPSFLERQSALDTAEYNQNIMNIPIPISTFRFAIESKDSSDSNDVAAIDSKAKKLVCGEKSTLSYQFESQINLNNYGGPSYDDSSCSNNLHIDYQSDHNGATIDSKADLDTKTEQVTISNDERSKTKDQSNDEKSSRHKSSRSSRDSRRHSSSRHSKDRRSESKHHTGSNDNKESHKSDTKLSKDETSHSSKSRHSSQREKSKDSSDKRDKDRTEPSKDKSTSHKSSSSSHRDSKSKHHSSSSSRRHSSTSSSKHLDDKKSSTSTGVRDKSDDKKDDSKDHRSSSKSSSRDHSRHSSSHRSDRDKSKSSNIKDKSDKETKKDDKKDKKVIDDHYSASGRGNRTRRSTDRDSNDGNSSSSKGSTFISGAKTADNPTGEKTSSSKSENNTSSGDSTGQSDRIEQSTTEHENDYGMNENMDTAKSMLKPVIVLDSHLNTPIAEAPQLPPVKNVSVRKPMIAANMSEAIKLMKIRKSMAVEQEKKRQEAALLIEFQEKIHSSISQVFSGVSGPELEFACQSGNGSSLNDKIADIKPEPKLSEQIVEIEEMQDISIVEETTNMNKNNTVIQDHYFKTSHNDKESNMGVDEKKFEDAATENCVVSKIHNFNEQEQDEHEDDFLNFLCGDPNKELDLHFFSHQEIYAARVERNRFSAFYESLEKVDTSKKIFLLNCDLFETDLFKQVSAEMGDYTIISYCQKAQKVTMPKSGLNKLNNQDLTMSKELILPVQSNQIPPTTNAGETRLYQEPENSSSDSTYTFSATNISSDCSMDSTMDYEQNINEMINKTSRQEIMEIIFGGITSDSPSKMPSVVFSDSRTDDQQISTPNLKRKRNGLTKEENGAKNNNHEVLMPNKIRKLSLSEQISSTTVGETNHIEIPDAKSKLMGRARRVGLPKPKSASNSVPMSPSSDKSVENYEQNSPLKKSSPKLNGTVTMTKVQNVANNKTARKHKLQQRYDTSDLYKPKLHYLSKRNSHIT